MKIQIRGFSGPLARRARALLEECGHQAVDSRPDCVLFFPGSGDGSLEALDRLVQAGGFRRLVLRSHTFVYGSSTKNPGLMTEERVSLLSDDAPEQRWLRAEAIAARAPQWTAIRLANILDAGEGDLVVRKLSRRSALLLAGHDPNMQFISLDDAARALVRACESNATGVFNAAGGGVIPLRKALKAAGTRRVPLLKPLFRRRADSIDQLQYNWTVSGERAHRELGFEPAKNTVEAFRDFLGQKRGAHPERLAEQYDEWGLDPDYLRAWGWWFAFLRRVYWRIESEGMENIPDTGRGIFVANHRSFMPLDAVMHLSLVLTQRRRVIRFLIIHSLLKFPFLCNFLTKVGGVIANQENAERLFAGENLVGIFPEGIRGAFSPYKTAYKLRDFGKSAFTKLAIENQTPIIPCAVVGHVEMFPILARINSSYITREFGWPYFPIAPMFPLAPVPLPSKWHVRVLEPVPVSGFRPSDAENPRLLKEFSRHIQAIIQANVDDMHARRKHIFWGKFLDGTKPAVAPFQPRVAAGQPAAGESAVASL